MKKQRTIQSKVTALLLLMVLTALIMTAVLSLWSLYSMRAISEENNRILGQDAEKDAEERLEEMAGERLLSTAAEKAAYIEEKFNTIIAGVDGIAQTAEAIYQNPLSYPDRQAALPVRDSRELSVQLLWSSRLWQAVEDAREAPEYQSDALTEQLLEINKLGNIQDLLLQYNANNDMISSACLATVSGWTLQADYIAYSKYSGESELPDYYEADTRQWFQKACAAKQGQYVYTDIMEDIQEGKNCIVCAKAVYFDGEIVAVAGIGSYLDTVDAAVLDTVIGESGYAFLVNEKGQIIASGVRNGETAALADNDIRESDNAKLAKAAQDMVEGGSGLEKLTLDEREVYLAYAPINSLSWSFVTVMEVEEVIGPAKESQQNILALTDRVSLQQNKTIRKTIYLFLGIMLAETLIIGWISVLFSGKLTEPIHSLTKEAARIGAGNWSSPICIHTGDEVEELGNAFNAMTGQLQKYMEYLAAAAAGKERIRTELELASKIQADILPGEGRIHWEKKDFSLYASMTPAKEAGGDFYDFFLTDDDHLVILIANVSGKGIPASLFMVVAKTMLQSRIEENAVLAKAVAGVNNKLCVQNKNSMFVTAWIGILTISTGVLTYVNAGHNPPLLGNPKKGYRYLKEKDDFVLGIMENMNYVQKEQLLETGDILFLYTDGVTKTNNEENSMYGELRLAKLLNGSSETEPKQLANLVLDEIQDFQGNEKQFDDITMLVLNYRGEKIKKAFKAPFLKDEVRCFVEKQLTQNNIAKDSANRLLIACDEIISNLRRYSAAKEITVEWALDKNKAILIFEDDGMEFDPLKYPEPDITQPLETRAAGGLGIYLVKKLMDELYYKRADGKNRFTIIKQLKGEENE